MKQMNILVLILLASGSFCSPTDFHRNGAKKSDVKEDDVDQLSGDDTILDNIIKVNKGNDVNIYEGDIELTPDDIVDLSDSGDVDGGQISARLKRNAERNRKKLWVSRVVPYVYDSNLPASYQPTIQEAITEFENRTCIRFVPRTNEDLFIKFVHDIGCWSSVGRQYWMTGIGQQVSLGPGCNHKGTIMHELMHAIGFWHEQSRPDRNLYVEVLWENIQNGDEHNFNKYSHREIDPLKIPYDFDSIMHYGRKSFSKNGQDTIRSILNKSRALGQRDGFTGFDIHEINALYDCSTKSGWSSWSNFGPCSTYCQKDRQRFCTSSDLSKDCPGADQYGVQQESIKCNLSECYAPIDGHWGRWSSWGACDADCGFGTHYRTRSCDDPPPKYGGKLCMGSSTSSQPCKMRSCEIGLDDCEFDADVMCHWTNDKNNPSIFNWRRNTGTTPSSRTGPSGDHTSGSGHYIYTESSGVSTGNQARLLSRTFPSTSGRCLLFWYHMYGSGMRALNVYIKPQTGAMTKVWTVSGDQGDEWKMKQVTLTSSSSSYQVVFEAVRGTSFRSDIALDDISFHERPCLEEIGCFKDKPILRALPELVKSLRGKIDWNHIEKTVAKCANLVQNKGYKVFGVQYYAECWSSSDDGVQYDKYGSAPPGGCWNGVGKQWENYVYRIV